MLKWLEEFILRNPQEISLEDGTPSLSRFLQEAQD